MSESGKGWLTRFSACVMGQGMVAGSAAALSGSRGDSGSKPLRRRLKAATATFATGLALATFPAAALVVSGSFTGHAFDEIHSAGDGPPGPPAQPVFQGADVQGRFSLDTDFVTAGTRNDGGGVGDGYAIYRLPPGALELSFTVLGQTYRFGNEGLDSTVEVYNHPPEDQSIFIGANFYGGGTHVAMLNFSAAGLNPLFEGTDLATFHASSVPLGTEFTGYSLNAFFRIDHDVGARVELSSIRFDGATTPVPEPTTTALMLAGVAAVAMARRWPRGGTRAPDDTST